MRLAEAVLIQDMLKIKKLTLQGSDPTVNKSTQRSGKKELVA